MRFERWYQGPNNSNPGQPSNGYNPFQQQHGNLANYQSPFTAYTLQHDINKENQWFPDSGASNHVTHDPTNLSYGA